MKKYLLDTNICIYYLNGKFELDDSTSYMKTIFSILFILLFYSSGYCQEINMGRNELTKTLCKTWKIDSILIDGKKADLGVSIQLSRMQFNNDNTFSEKSTNEKSEKGNWEYNKEKLCVELFRGDKLIGTIKSLNSLSLVYLPFLNDEAKRFIKSSEIYLVPN